MTPTLKTLISMSLCLALLTALACPRAEAQDSNYKIGVVDIDVVLAKYEKRKSKYEDLQKEVQELQAGVDAMAEKIESAKKDYEQKRANLSPEELLQLESQIRADISDYQNEWNKRQQKIDSMEALVLREAVKDIQATIKEIAEKGNYHLVLRKDEDPRSGVLYAHTSIDMTSQVLDALNK